MSLVWAVPVVAAAVATVLVAMWARVVEDEATGLVAEARRLRQIAHPLAAVRETLRETDGVATTFGRRHPFDADQ